MPASTNQARPRTFGRWSGDTASLLNALTASETGAELDSLLANVLNTPNTTVYDKAIDSVYLQTQVGGARLHHLLDGQHDLMGAFAAAHEAVPHDSLANEILGCAHHLAKDLFSVMGLPVVSLNPDHHRQAADWVQQHLGISKGWQADLLQINGMELLGGALSVAAVMFGVQRADAQALAEMAGGSGLAGVVAANPLAIIAAAAAMVLAWRIHVKGDCWEPLVRRAATGTAAAATAIAAGSLLGGFAATGALPLIISIGLSLIAGLVVKHFLNRAAAAGTSTDVAAQACPGQDANALRMHVVLQARQIRDALDETALRVLRRALA